MDTNTAPTQREIFLAEMECSVPWHKLRALVEPICGDPAGVETLRRGVRPFGLDRLLRIYFLQRWFRLTDAAVREAVCDSLAMRSFVCVGPGPDIVPDEMEIGRFGGLLREFGLADVMVLAADRHLRSLGMAVAPGAIVDAALIKTSNAYAQAPYARVIDTAGVCAG